MDVDKLLEPPRGVIASPWPKLTEIVNGGPRPGELWVLGARPSVGKTLALLQWSLTAAAAGHQVKFFSLEMPVAISSAEQYRAKEKFPMRHFSAATCPRNGDVG
jgi:replicative DNA helicase